MVTSFLPLLPLKQAVQMQLAFSGASTYRCPTAPTVPTSTVPTSTVPTPNSSRTTNTYRRPTAPTVPTSNSSSTTSNTYSQYAVNDCSTMQSMTAVQCSQ